MIDEVEQIRLSLILKIGTFFFKKSRGDDTQST